MLKSVLLVCLFASATAFAAASKCVDENGNDMSEDSAKFLKVIAAQKDCADAAKLAEACAWGSSMDEQTVVAAMNICDQQTAAHNPSASVKNHLAATKATCDAKYANKDGTLYKSENSYCYLDATVAAFYEVATEMRCGYFENPTPNNAWLDDAQGTWIIATQGAGGWNADGDWPGNVRNDRRYWAVAPGAPQDGYGYGCACLRVSTDKSQMLVNKIYSSKDKPLKACQQDPALKKIKIGF